MPVEREWLVKPGVNLLKTLSRTKRKKQDLNVKIYEISRFGEENDLFWNNVSKDYQFIVERNSKYLNWRYADPRLGKHIIYSATREDQTIGYIVLRVNRFIEEYPVGYIVDLLTTEEEADTAWSLVNKAVQYFKEQKINLVNCLMVKGSRYEKSLTENKFLDSRINIHMFYQSNLKEDPLKNRVNPERLHFTWGDHDSLPLAVSRT